MPRWIQGAVAAAVVLATCSTRASEARVHTRVLLLCRPDDPCEAFAARLRGQTSDLSVDLSVERAWTGAATLEEDWDAAERTADDRGDRPAFVVWWRGGEVVTLVREPPPGRVLRRTITRRTTLVSADLEAGALATRSAIESARRGAAIGEARAARAQQTATVATPRPARGLRPDAAADPARASASLGWTLAWDGVANDPGQALDGRAGIAWPHASVGALWVEGLRKQVDVAMARGKHGRRLFGIVADATVAIAPRWQTDAGLRAGASMITVVPQSGPYLDVVRITRPFAGAELRLRRWLAARVAVTAAIAIDHVWEPPVITLRSASGETPLWNVARWQPSGTLALQVQMP